MPTQQDNNGAVDDELSGKRINNKIETDESDVWIKLDSIRGGGGVSKRKRPEDIDDGLYDSDAGGDSSPNHTDNDETEPNKVASAVATRLRNKNLKTDPKVDDTLHTDKSLGIKLDTTGNVIPKKKLASNTSDANEYTSSSLLSKMQTAPVNPVNQPVVTHSRSGRSVSPPKPNATSSATKTSPPRIDSKPSGTLTAPSNRFSEQPRYSQNDNAMKIKQETSQDTKVAPGQMGKQETVQDTKVAPGQMGKQETVQDTKVAPSEMGKQDPQRYILQNLGYLCEHYSHDINFTFIPPSKSGIDLSGSFLRTDEGDSLDFFDLNERGEIVLQPRPPIFPEELPSGMKEHSLQWWGVVDPAVGDGRFKVISAQPVPEHAAPPSGEDRSRQSDSYHQREEHSNGHDRKYNPRDLHDPYGPPPQGGPPFLGRPRGPDRRRDRR